MNRRSSRTPHRSRIPGIGVQFDPQDEAERRAADWIERFHEPQGVYELLDVRRGRPEEGGRQVIMLTRCQTTHRGAKPRWLLIIYALDEDRIILPSYPTLRAARAAFKTAAARHAARHVNPAVRRSPA